MASLRSFLPRLAPNFVFRRPIVRPIVARRPRAKNGNGNGNSNGGSFVFTLQGFVNFVKNAISNGTFLVTTAIVCYVLFSFHNHADKSIVMTGINKLIEDNNFKTIGEWLKANIVKFVGFIAFVPAIINSPNEKQAFTAVVAFLWVWFIPEHTSYEYIIQGILLYLFIKTKSDKYKMFIFVIILILYFGQYIITFSDLACTNIKDKPHCIRNCKWSDTLKCTAPTTQVQNQAKGESG